jgi:hypothetical protein
MRIRTTAYGALFAMLALAGPAVAACREDVGMPAGAAAQRDGGALAARPGAGDQRSAMVPEDASASVPDRLVGRVLALDPEHGRLLLGTDGGMIALRGSPEQLADLEVGDTIEVALEQPREQPQRWI